MAQWITLKSPTIGIDFPFRFSVFSHKQTSIQDSISLQGKTYKIKDREMWWINGQLVRCSQTESAWCWCGGPSRGLLPNSIKRKLKKMLSWWFFWKCLSWFLIRIWLFSQSEDLRSSMLLRMALVHFGGTLIHILNTASWLRADPSGCWYRFFNLLVQTF